MFQHLKSSTYGANRSKYEYLSYVITRRSLLTMSQQDKIYTEGISKRLESALLILNLDGGNMNTEELQANERVINTLRSDEDTAVAVEDKLIDTLLIDSESDNKYGDLPRSIINSVTQGQNRYPNIKVAAYTLLCKYIPEHIDNKNKSTTMHGRPATGVSFYRRGTPNDEPPVAGTNDVTEYMITCWKCRRRGHRYPLCPKSNDTFFQGMQLMFTQVMYPPFA